jgi:hypothetical protein
VCARARVCMCVCERDTVYLFLTQKRKMKAAERFLQNIIIRIIIVTSTLLHLKNVTNIIWKRNRHIKVTLWLVVCR